MSDSTHFTTASGRRVDLGAPSAADIDFADIAEQLAKLARFNGATPGCVYSVAQHSLLGTARILTDSDDLSARTAVGSSRHRVACYFLCHDMHEAYLGDDTTPKKRTLDAVAAQFGIAAGAISEAYARVTERFDAAIHAAAGLAWPPEPAIRAAVDAVDRRMLATEWRALRPGHALPEALADVAPFAGMRVSPSRWEASAHTLLQWIDWLLPSRMPAPGARAACRAPGGDRA